MPPRPRATLFIGFLLVFLPAQVLSWSGIVRPVGAGLALAGAALFYESWALLAYCAAFWLLTHLFVVLYEEPALRATLGSSYTGYCDRVHRWWPI